MSDRCGVIEQLLKENKITENEAEKLRCKLQDNSIDIKKIAQKFNKWLRDLVVANKKEPKSTNLDTKIRYYTVPNPNSRGTYISDFDIIVDKSNMPFNSLDQVDHFLTNFIGLAENEKLKPGDKNKKDASLFFSNIEKNIPASFHTIKRPIPEVKVDEEVSEPSKNELKNKIKVLENKNMELKENLDQYREPRESWSELIDRNVKQIQNLFKNKTQQNGGKKRKNNRKTRKNVGSRRDHKH